MELSELRTHLKNLSESDRLILLEEMGDSKLESTTNCQMIRRQMLDNKQGECPHCGHSKYVKFGKKSGSHRYKCKSCTRSFTECTGTWMAGLHHKKKIDAYLQLMLEEKSLDKIKEELQINKKTAFDWRHKILSSISSIDKDDFTGITESDETFFLHSTKGKSSPKGGSRKRGGTSSKRGVNSDHIAVIVTQDRTKQLDLTVATRGRLKKVDITNAIGHRITQQTILCSDSHVSYKGFAIDNKIEHHPLRSDLKQRVKNKVYHIQHVNSTHNRIKKWIDEKFWGVSTKYLQQYLDWYRVKEIFKNSTDRVNEFAKKSVQDIQAIRRYKDIPDKYQKLISTQI